VTFLNEGYFYSVRLLASLQTPKLEDHSWSAVHDLFNVFAANLHIWRPSPPSATQGTRHAVVTGTHGWSYSLLIGFNCLFYGCLSSREQGWIPISDIFLFEAVSECVIIFFYFYFLRSVAVAQLPNNALHAAVSGSIPSRVGIFN
jgi:hypothetical protein